MAGEELEELLKKDVLKAIEDWGNRAKLMNKEDFDSPKNYKKWLDDIRVSKKIEIVKLRWRYKRAGVPEDIINKVIDELKDDIYDKPRA